MWVKKYRWILGVALLAVLFASPVFAAAKSKGKFIVGSKEYVEQQILGQMAALIMEDAGYTVERKIPLGGTNIVRQALVSKQIDGYVDYTGTGAMIFFKSPKILAPDDAYKFVRDNDLKQNNLVWLPPMALNNVYTLMLREAEAEKLNLRTLSDLAEYVNKNPKAIKMGVSNEFFVRPDSLPKVVKVYKMNLDPKTVNQMDFGLIYLALRDGSINVGLGFTTDGRIKAYNLRALEDDKGVFASYHPCFILKKEIFDKDPTIAPYFAKLGPILDNAAIQELNLRVSDGGEKAIDVAREYLKVHEIIK